MKFDQLIEYDMRDTLFEQAFTEYGGQISPKTFLNKIKIEHIFQSTVWSLMQFVFIVCPSRELQKHIATKVLTTCF